jgi:hypothetical protein
MSILVVGGVITLAAMAAPAAASTVSSATSGGRQAALTLTRPAVTKSIPVIRNPSVAAYLSEKRGLRSVSTTFEVPKITTCTAHENAGMGPVVILTGSSGYFVGAGAEAECQDGATAYIIAINHNGAETHPLNVAARNEIDVHVTIGARSVLVKIDDLTTKKTVSQSVPKGKVTYAELGDDSLSQNGRQVPIPRFSNHLFSDVKINGRVLKDATPLFAEYLVHGKTILIKPSALNKAGNAFVMDFEHAS